jgi:hypothetical protein
MQDIIDKIIEKIKDDKIDFPEFLNSSYKAFQISNENFHEIKKIKPTKKIIFLDGGNLELIKAPNISLFFNRVYYCIYQNNKRIKNDKYEFYTLITAENKNNKLFFNVEFEWTKDSSSINSDLSPFVFDVNDKTLSYGNRTADISDIGNAVRKLIELEIANQIIKENKDSIIVLDRNLEAAITYEKKYLENLYQTAKDNNVFVCALPKTSSLLTRNGNSISALLNQAGPGFEWYYYPVAELNTNEHKADLYFVKLNKKSNYVFRLDVYKEKKYEIDEILSLLAENSKDPVFFGYPYGLIEADRFARVSNKESEFLRMQIMVKLGKNAEKLKKYLASQDAHSILDSVA